MKKIIIAVVVVAVLAVAGFLLMGGVGSFVAKTIETEGTKALGVPVKVGGVTIDIAKGLAGVSGLTIGNVEGYSKPYAFQLNEFSAEVDYSTLEIAEINIAKPVITAETKGLNMNFKDLVDGLSSGSGETESAEEATSEELPEITIKLFKLTEATVQLIVDEVADGEFVMDPFIVRNLKGTPDVIAERISSQLSSHVLNQVMGFKAEQEIQGKVDEAMGDALKEKFGEKGEGGKIKLPSFGR